MRNWGRLLIAASAAVFLPASSCAEENASKNVNVNLFSDGPAIPFQIELMYGKS